MPRRKKNYRRKNYRKKKTFVQNKESKEITNTGKPKTSIILYKGIGIPSIYCCKLKYSEHLSFTSGAYNDFIIRGNGPYDPKFAAFGGQPMYWDQLTALYNRYTAISSSVAVTFVNKTSTGEASFTKVGIYPLGDSTTAMDINTATERDNCKYSQLGPNSGDQGIITIDHYAKATAILGKAKDENTDDILSADISSVPARQWFWHIFAGTLDQLTATNVYIDVTVTYYVKFFNRKEVSRS